MTTTTASLRLDANLKWLFTELPFVERFDAAAQAGFSAVEYASPYEYSPAFLKKCLADSGLEQILINTPAGPPESVTRSGSACIPDRVQEFQSGFLTALEYAVELDANLIHVMGGIRPAHVSRDAALATYITNIGWAVEQAESSAVTLVLESINKRDAPDFVLDSIDQAAAVVNAVGSGHVGILFDVYHCQVDHGDISARLHQLMPVIAHLQIADVPGRAEPGTGEIAWNYVFEQLRRLQYGGWVGCEYRPAGGTLEGLVWQDKFTL
jgi:hydroxypyruvate isomerase